MPLVLARLAWRALREPEYARRTGERFARIAALRDTPPVWVHAVSAGETIAIVPLIRELRARRPALPILVTTMTPTGSERVRSLLGDEVIHCYLPYDLPHLVRRFLDRVTPRMLLLTDTELWPNILHQCAERKIPVVQVNARLSRRSARRYGRIARLTRAMLESLAHVAAQSESQGARFVELGLPPARLTVTGSIKFDLALPADLAERSNAIRRKIGDDRTVFVAASTHEGEEAALLEAARACAAEYPKLLLVLVPRHPARFEAVARAVADAGLGSVRRSEGTPCSPETQVLVVDTMGELLYFYNVADFAFIGGSLAPVGGHNLMEAAALGVPMLMGPYRFNIEEISGVFLDAGALVEVPDGPALMEMTKQLCRDTKIREEMGRAALAVMAAHRGALARTLEIVERFLVE